MGKQNMSWLLWLPLLAGGWLGFSLQQWAPLGLTLAMSGLSFIAYGWDKRQARLGRWRLPESRLLLLAMLGGWPGALLGADYWRHKTQKQPYVRWLLAVIALHYLLWSLYLFAPYTLLALLPWLGL
ncbi:MAG: DUF1294 domain-containing protein [Aeromonas sp.]